MSGSPPHSDLRIALLQMCAYGDDQIANMRKGEDYCRLARSKHADIAVFPEMWNIGYTLCDPSDDQALKEWRRHAIDVHSPFVKRFQALAAELKMAILLTFLERWEGLPRNTAALIDRHGKIVLRYAKVHTCEFDREAALTPGDGFYVSPLDTAKGPVKMGVMICFDREFPESARLLMLNGAEIILTPNACTMDVHRISQFRARAFENMVGVALANYASPQANGHSIAFDARAYDEDENCLDNLLVEADGTEGVFLADFNLQRLRDYRHREVWGNAYRHPQVYQDLVSSDIEPPFVRKRNWNYRY